MDNDREENEDEFDDNEDFGLDGFLEIGDENSEEFMTFLQADERAFVGECNEMLNDLIRDSMVLFTDLVDEVFANGWSHEAATATQDLGVELLHINEHITSGFVPLTWFSGQDFNCSTFRAAPGKWIVPAVQTWMAIASTEGLNGLMRSRLPWVLPLSLEVSGELGYAASVNIDIGVGRIGDVANFLIERGEIAPEDIMALVSSIQNHDDAIRLSGDLAEMWFDVEPSTDGELAPESSPMRFSPDEDGKMEFVDTSLDRWGALMNTEDFSYDWAAAATITWLMWLGIQVLFRENAHSNVAEVDNEELTIPLMLKVRSASYWAFPDLDEELVLSVDASEVYRVENNPHLLAALDEQYNFDALETKIEARDEVEKISSSLYPADVEDMEHFITGNASLVALTAVEGRTAFTPPLAVEIHEDIPEVGSYLRAISIPQEFAYGNALRVAFHTFDGEFIEKWKIKQTNETDEKGITASGSILGAVQSGTGIASAKVLDNLTSAMRYLMLAKIDQRTLSDSVESWAVSLMALARTTVNAAMDGLNLLVAEHAPSSTAVCFSADVWNNLTQVNLLNKDVQLVSLLGSDLARRDAIYCDLEGVYRALALTKEAVSIAAIELMENDNDADELASSFLQFVTNTQEGLTLTLHEDLAWGARLGTVQVSP